MPITRDTAVPSHCQARDLPEPGTVAIVGGGPAGLMAAEAAAALGARVTVYEARPSVGRKFLVAGRGGLNLTHSEPAAPFLARYGAARTHLAPLLERFGADAVRAWAAGLGVETFIGSSGRVFPVDFKAGPLLRRWVHRLHETGVRLCVRHRCTGLETDGTLRFDTPDGPRTVRPAACVLALGGGSWPHLGSDGAWVPWLSDLGVAVRPLQPANCGFDTPWSEWLASRFAGAPVKSVVASATAPDGSLVSQAGELMITATGVEGGVVYALSAALREAIVRHGVAWLRLDLTPGLEEPDLAERLARPRGSRSLASHLERLAGIRGVKAALLRERTPAEDLRDPRRLAARIKALTLPLQAPRPLAEAISSAGGVSLGALDAGLGVAGWRGLYCAGEMLDWEAPTGGYLLTACMATGLAAGQSAASHALGDGTALGAR